MIAMPPKKTNPITAFLLPATLLLTAVAQAETYHVSDRNGDDTKDGLAADTAWKTLAHACEKVALGDTVTVHAGVYHEHVRLEKAGTAEKPIRFTADAVAKNRVVLTGARRDIRQGDVIWKTDDAKLGLHSLKVDARPARVLSDETDLFPYASLDELKTRTLAGGVPGPARGFAYDEKEKRLFVRLSPLDGAPEPGGHRLKVAPAGTGRRADKPTDANFSIATAGPANVVLEGFTFETPGLCGVAVTSGGVTVRDCWFLGCRTGIAGRPAEDGKSTDDVTVMRCEFSAAPVFADVEEIAARARTPARPGALPIKLSPYFWTIHTGGPAAYDFGLVLNAGARWKILGNYIHDAVDGLSHWSLTDAKDTEIAGNTFERLVDNAIESGSHCGRLDAHDNFITDVFQSFSWDPKDGLPWPGPLNFHHNTVTSTVRGAKLWAALGLPPSCFELNCADANWEPARMKDVPTSPVKIPGTGLTAYNNTILLPTGDFFSFTGLRYRRIEGVRFFNNLTVTRSLTPDRYHDAADLSGMEFDGNLAAPGLPDAKGPGTRFAGAHGKVVDDAAKLGLRDPARRIFSLQEKSPALGGGVAVKDLPTLSKDIGAHAKASDGRHALAGPQPTTQP